MHMSAMTIELRVTRLKRKSEKTLNQPPNDFVRTTTAHGGSEVAQMTQSAPLWYDIAENRNTRIKLLTASHESANTLNYDPTATQLATNGLY